MSLVMVAAEAREFSGLLPLCSDVRRARLPVHWARTATLAGRPVTLVANGAGVSRAADAAELVPDIQAIVSVGFCGAVDPDLGIGDVITATEVEGSGLRFRACQPNGSSGPSGLLVTLDHVVQTAEEKASLRQTGAAIVDMEAAGVAALAEGIGVPFFCIRSVTDLAHESFHNDFNAALRSDGHFDTINLLRAATLDPRSRLPELIRMGRRVRVAAGTLGDFLANCRF